MSPVTAVMSFVVTWGLFPLPVAPQGVYGTAVTFREGECWFWTGDVGLTAEQFKEDLKGRFAGLR